VLRQVVAEVLGLSLDEVQVELATTDVFETDSGVGGSRVTPTDGARPTRWTLVHYLVGARAGTIAAPAPRPSGLMPLASRSR